MPPSKLQVELHPAANIFPMMSRTELDALKADITKHGQLEAVVFFGGKLLDGRNRYLACEELGIEPNACELDDDVDPVAYVISQNLYRRHLTESQRAMSAAKARGFYDEQAKERQKEGQKSGGRGRKKNYPVNLPESNGDARDAVGQVFRVSGSSVDHATHVLTQGSEALQSAVERGEVSVSKAAKVAKSTPKSEQLKVATAKNGRKAKTNYERTDALLKKLNDLLLDLRNYSLTLDQQDHLAELLASFAEAARNHDREDDEPEPAATNDSEGPTMTATELWRVLS